jgi:hypothetical protein
MDAKRDEETGRWTVDGMEATEVIYERLCRMLHEGKNFKFARYGDGEFNCMFGKVGRNCDQHEYFPDLGKRLNKAFLEADYILGIQPLALTLLYKENIITKSTGKDIVNADVFHNASIDKQLSRFTDALDHRHVIVVGPLHLQRCFLDCVHIVIPDVNCWTNYEQVKSQIAFHIDGVHNAVVILCASMMSEVLIDDFKDDPHTFIDAGSVFDPYCNVKSRRYHHKLTL